MKDDQPARRPDPQAKQPEKKPEENQGHARSPDTEPPKDKRSDDL